MVIVAFSNVKMVIAVPIRPNVIRALPFLSFICLNTIVAVPITFFYVKVQVTKSISDGVQIREWTSRFKIDEVGKDGK